MAIGRTWMSKKSNYFYKNGESLYDEIKTVEEVAPQEVKKTFSHQKLHDALMYAVDIFDRAFTPVIVMGEIANEIHTQELPVLTGDRVELGVLKKHLTQDSLPMLKTVCKDIIIDKDLILFEYRDVPVEVKIFYDDIDYLRQPDTRFYYTEEVRLPNPFDKYWEEKGAL